MSRREISIAFQTDKTASQYVALAQLVDQYDFDTVSVYCDAPFHPSYGPLLLMAPHIRRARLGPAAVSPARVAPIDMAAETALLAQIARGGVYLGIARGAWLGAHGIRDLERPIQAVRECVDVVRYLLSGAQGGYQGQMFSLAPHVRAPYLLPPSPIPIMIGTWGEKLAAVAGETADEVKIGGSANPAFVPLMRRYIARGEMKAGREPGSVGIAVGAVTVVDEDREQARAGARRAAVLYLPVVAPLDPTAAIEPELIARIQSLVGQDDLNGAARLISDPILDRFAFSGNADDLIRQAEALFQAGASRVEFGTPHGLKPERGIRLIGERVIPALRH